EVVERLAALDLAIHERRLQHAERAQTHAFLLSHRVGDRGADVVNERQSRDVSEAGLALVAARSTDLSGLRRRADLARLLLAGLLRCRDHHAGHSDAAVRIGRIWSRLRRRRLLRAGCLRDRLRDGLWDCRGWGGRHRGYPLAGGGMGVTTAR